MFYLFTGCQWEVTIKVVVCKINIVMIKYEYSDNYNHKSNRVNTHMLIK